jgi:hypothetical protein
LILKAITGLCKFSSSIKQLPLQRYTKNKDTSDFRFFLFKTDSIQIKYLKFLRNSSSFFLGKNKEMLIIESNIFSSVFIILKLSGVHTLILQFILLLLLISFIIRQFFSLYLNLLFLLSDHLLLLLHVFFRHGNMHIKNGKKVRKAL